MRLGLYGPFNPGVHVATPLAQLQSLVKCICNIMYGLTGYKYSPACLFLLQITAKCIFGTQIARKILPPRQKIITSAVWIEWRPEVGAFFTFIGA